ncbi:MAG TPA: ester cyclase [Candidatus Limnocylindrales bacterium]|nr:ester cyclase [Candidatus Limnocylindrales bacterium]
MTKGRVESIGITPAGKAPIVFVKAVRAIAGRGLEGDRYFVKEGTYSNEPGEGRDVTLIESEAVEAMNAKLGTDFAAGEMRRNIVTRGIALNHLVGRDFRAGGALLRGIRLCEPCAYLQSMTRDGVLKQLIHRGGLRANIIADGEIHAGDEIMLLDDPLEENKNLIRRFFDEMWNPWNFAKADELLAEGIVFRGTLGSELKGRDAFRGYMRKVQAAFPDFHNSILQMTAEEDRVVARTMYRGTHRGEIFGVSPTGKEITYAGAAFFRIADGKVAEGWVLGDLLSVLRQMGASKIP